jgi:hypothetical protein
MLGPLGLFVFNHVDNMQLLPGWANFLKGNKVPAFGEWRLCASSWALLANMCLRDTACVAGT